MIGIIGAMDVEVQAIKNKMHNIEEINYLDSIFYKGNIKEKEVVLCKSGVGKVNAAIITTILLYHFDIDFVINIGTSGGMIPSQETLDIVISDRVIQHDFDTSYLDGPEGLGIYSQSDKSLGDKIKEAFDKNHIEANIYFGDIISGDKFVGDNSLIKDLREKFPQAIACEMEAGAVGQACEKFSIPFVVIRSLSDIVDKDNSENDFLKNVEITSKRSADMVESFIENLA
ncbi:5'-methylthioadenosine/adenosylhomocysteine nucleosidase [uncultured Helcococcus sp.]|uniref:5'-methylthioadenosine/adenosylhomocysteine nucleosidase n=1 Tax=uncultured Helcococcus sp. TaxID=1072508 RepID=UPI002635462D|nr:5'-methylthioadenosine/adenosylhomocysteine nucleosidase [uncultured Helcococcus sp.]